MDFLIVIYLLSRF